MPQSRSWSAWEYQAKKSKLHRGEYESPHRCSDEKIAEIRERYGADDDQLLVVVAPRGGRKRLSDLVSSLAELDCHSTVRFVVAIRSTVFPTYIQWLREEGIDVDKLPDNVILADGPPDFYDLVWASDAMFCRDSMDTMTSLLPLTWMEAMIRGTPVIGYDVPGAGECLREDETGMLVKPGESLLPQLEKLLCRETRQEMARKARQQARDEYLVPKLAEQYLEIWQQLSGKSVASNIENEAASSTSHADLEPEQELAAKSRS